MEAVVPTKLKFSTTRTLSSNSRSNDEAILRAIEEVYIISEKVGRGSYKLKNEYGEELNVEYQPSEKKFSVRHKNYYILYEIKVVKCNLEYNSLSSVLKPRKTMC